MDTNRRASMRTHNQQGESPCHILALKICSQIQLRHREVGWRAEGDESSVHTIETRFGLIMSRACDLMAKCDLRSNTM